MEAFNNSQTMAPAQQLSHKQLPHHPANHPPNQPPGQLPRQVGAAAVQQQLQQHVARPS
jgi:hypothetical protein